jgi:hypothetical protein
MIGKAMSDLEAQEVRYKQLLGEANIEVSDTSLRLYRTYIQENITKPCELTGIEDFRWEEYYILGPGDKKQYEELKKTRPSYIDLFTYMHFDEIIDDSEGLMVRIKRVSDRKQFVIPLADLKVTNKESPNYQLIDDYAVWYVNY